MKIRYMLVQALIIIPSVAASGYFFYHDGFDKGVDAAVLKVQASCESDNSVTHLNGKPYVCLTVATWNKIVTIMHAIGADGSNGGGDADEPLPPLPHGPSPSGLTS